MKTRVKFPSRAVVALRAFPLVFTVFLTPAVLVTASAQTSLPELVDSNLRVRIAATGLNSPTSMAFIGANDILVLEKPTGRVLRIINGTVQATPVLDLGVNSGSERGLLGIALHPRFPSNPSVYLFWTESTTGVDTTVLGQTPLL
ncbi:MAG: PQQ-dependent sugar dehydrogenase, partial [Opitutaceae bacterium]